MPALVSHPPANPTVESLLEYQAALSHAGGWKPQPWPIDGLGILGPLDNFPRNPPCVVSICAKVFEHGAFGDWFWHTLLRNPNHICLATLNTFWGPYTMRPRVQPVPAFARACPGQCSLDFVSVRDKLIHSALLRRDRLDVLFSNLPDPLDYVLCCPAKAFY